MSNEHPTFVDAYFDDVVMTLNPSVVVAMNDYYAGGATFLSFARDGTPNKRRYQGKEWNSDLGLDQYDFEWRQHDPFIWRTTTQDPHGERYPRLSSYSWAANNPVSIIDPDGRDITQTADRFSFTGSSMQQAFVNLRNQYDAFLSKQRANDQRNKANASSSGSTAVSAGGGGATKREGADVIENGVHKPEISQDMRQMNVILNMSGEIIHTTKGDGQIHVLLGSGELEPFHHRLIRNGTMKPADFSNGLLNIVNGMELPEKNKFDREKLHNGKISIALLGGITFNDGELFQGYATHETTVKGGFYKITYTQMYNKDLTVEGIRAQLGIHEYYAHGVRNLRHPSDNAEITNLVNEYLLNKN